MKLITSKTYDEMSQKTYELIKSGIERNPQAVISLTTGASPLGLVRLISDAVKHKHLDISQTTFINIDEYLGSADNNYSVRTFMNENLYNGLAENERPARIIMFNGEAEDKNAEIERYRKLLKQYPRDIQIIGLGINGHLGCNEPGTPFDQEVFIGNLSESTIAKTMGQYGLSYAECPKQMYTMGLKDLMESKQVILQAAGRHKAPAVKALLQGKLSAACPASVLMLHSNFVCFIDEEAGSLL